LTALDTVAVIDIMGSGGWLCADWLHGKAGCMGLAACVLAACVLVAWGHRLHGSCYTASAYRPTIQNNNSQRFNRCITVYGILTLQQVWPPMHACRAEYLSACMQCMHAGPMHACRVEYHLKAAAAALPYLPFFHDVFQESAQEGVCRGYDQGRPVRPVC
jgi:hypothetical protein